MFEYLNKFYFNETLNLFEEDFRHHPKIVGHILEAECAALLRDFFAQVREKEMQT